MVDFAKLLRDVGVPILNKQTASLQAVVTVLKQGSVDGAGDTIPGGIFEWPALVDWKSHRVRTSGGNEATSRAVVTFLEPREIDDDDQIVLPDGTTGPILDMAGFIDPGTGKPFVTDVYLG